MKSSKAYYAGLPKSLKVGACEVAIELKARLDNDDFGQFDPNDHAILLKNEQPSLGAAVDTLLHEIFHAIWTLTSLRVGDDEERIVSTLSLWQSQVLTDNPALTTWIAKATRGR